LEEHTNVLSEEVTLFPVRRLMAQMGQSRRIFDVYVESAILPIAAIISRCNNWRVVPTGDRADRDVASSDWSLDGAGQTYASGLPGCRHIAAELRDELLNGEILYSLKEAKIVVEQWRKHDNTVRPHSSLGYRPPAPQTMNAFLTPL